MSSFLPMSLGALQTYDEKVSDSRRIWNSAWKLGLAVMIGLTAGLLTWGPMLEEAERHTDALSQQYDLLGGLLLLDLFLGIITTVLVAFRRAAVLPITVAVAFVAGFSSFSIGALLLAVTSLSIRHRPWQIVITFIALLGGTLIQELLVWPRVQISDEGIPGGVVAVGLLLAFCLPVLLGWSVGSRRELVASLRREAATARAGREAAQSRVRAEERNRIAREFHDELGHRLSTIALHAGALEYREDVDPQQAREAAGSIRASAQQAMHEVRSTLQVLRAEPDHPESPEADAISAPYTPVDQADPPPDIVERLSALAQETTTAGSEVTLNIAADLQELPTDVGRHLYRIVQEALTNALRHSPGTPALVEINGIPGDRVDVVVSNPVLKASTERDGEPESRPEVSVGSGLGLTGALERAKLAGGGLSVESGAEFIVKAWFPWTR